MPRKKVIVWGLIGAVCLVPVLGMAYVGTYSRYLADDYCTAGILRSAGFWEGLLYWYQTWSGRISFFFLIQMVQLLGPGVTPYATGIALGLWFLTAYLLLAHLSRVIGLGSRRSWRRRSPLFW